jgi:hypothetical protein
MQNAIRTLVIIIVGGMLGIASFYFITGWYNVIPWAVVSLIIGYRSKTTRQCLVDGAIFGYVLFLVYMFVGYNAGTDMKAFVRFVLFDIELSLIGAIIGAAGSYAGFFLGGRKEGAKSEK